MRVSCLKSLKELACWADDWERLAAGVPFRGWTWLSHWWRHYGSQSNDGTSRSRLAVLCVVDDADALVGVAPWYLEQSAVRGRVLRPLGSGEVCSDYLSVLCQPGREAAVMDCLAEYLHGNASDDAPDGLRWDVLELDGIDVEDRNVAELVHCLSALGCSTDHQPGPNCWRLDLPASWESYIASLGKHQRRTVRRLERESLHTDRAVLHVATRSDELARAMDILIELHQRRRTALGEKGCFASPRFLSFFRDVVPALLRAGQVQLYWLELDGKPAAAEYHLAGGGVLYVYQAGVDPDLLPLQRGNLINLMILRRAIEQGYRAYDFLRGDEPYKARFGARPRSSMQYRVVPPRTAARLRHGLWRAGNSVKQWIKRGVRKEVMNAE
jgi:CelD/BcsL family acetyltransferase involved in cellulose biosynthesis